MEPGSELCDLAATLAMQAVLLDSGAVQLPRSAADSLAAVRRLEAGVSMAEVARGLEDSSNVLHRWQREFRQAPDDAFPGHGQRRWSEGQIAELERKIGRQAMEIDFLKGCLQRIEDQPMLQVSAGNPQCTGKSRKK